MQIPKTNVNGYLIINSCGKEPRYLFTNIAVTNFSTAHNIIHWYIRRWSVEDSDRAFKKIFNLENIRSRTYIPLKRLVHIATWDYAVLSRISLLPKKFLYTLIKSVKAFAIPKKIFYYRIAMSIALLFCPKYCRTC